ncbi:ferredoxin reductase family protein [Pseudodonghicola flavimaris]|uniref:Ferric reductase-like transmembrane domain-containing protein n=1 Tax=Pseudodonghicola flavimaris TaxID=3050036 RepID=A0ABT7F0N5_9RHOB|nr:ferric reductase-like transmembrane domain-containing protein [Pseudodonghicola flavimaris]MDK3018176.1 ferric reductase-like transmembrane domain-containing protein [Pseudodonghicola flavimaris]
MTQPNIRLFWGFWGLLGALWLLLNPDIFSAADVFALRQFFMQWTGTFSIAAMSVAMILSLRPRWPEGRLGGLDKMYRLHKWLGIGALGLSVFHWLWSEAPKWAVGAGLLARPERGPRPEFTDPVQAYLNSLRGTAEGLGEWAFYISAALMVVALLKVIPYRWFRYSHRILPVAYLVLVFHTVVLLDYDMWLTPLGVVMALLIIPGSYAAVVSVLGGIGRTRRVAGEITALRSYPGVRSLETEIRLGTGWPGHKAGQFAFVTSNRIEGAHPYTIASAWNPTDPKIAFVTKELGDHTSTLAEKLKTGQKVTVEGPYGCFTFDDGMARQIWIGAGIGITPFLARLKEMAAADPTAPRPEIDLFHSTREVDEAALERVAADARAANVRLHLLIDARDGRLGGERIRDAVPDWRSASLWFCGPSGFGKSLRQDFAAQGLDTEHHFHQELFEMR